MSLVNPHGTDRRLRPRMPAGTELAEARARARTLPKLPVTSRESSDLVMLGIGGFTPLDGFMTREDWRGVCDGFRLASGVFWPVPITLSASAADAAGCQSNEESLLLSAECNSTELVIDKLIAGGRQANSGRNLPEVLRIFYTSKILTE